MSPAIQGRLWWGERDGWRRSDHPYLAYQVG